VTYAWFDLGDGRQVYRKVPGPARNRSALPAPMLNLDTMDPVQSMVDGKLYTSKSALRDSYRHAGVVEVGNDPARLKKPSKPKPDRKGIKDAVERAKARHARGERPDTRPIPL
jgi:hypothetical protein